MIAEQGVERFEDLEDGPTSLGKKDDGKVPQYSWKDGRFVMVPMPKEGKGTGMAIASFSPGGGGGTSTIAGATDFTDTTGPGTDEYTINWDNDTGKFVLRAPVINTNTTTIADATDFTDTTGAGTDGYSVVWDDATNKFILSEITGGGGTPGGSDTQVQFNDGGAFGGAAGLIYDKANSRVGLGATSPVTMLHLNSSLGSAISGINANKHMLVLSRDNNNAAIAIVSSTSANSELSFGDVDDINAGEIVYSNSTGVMTLEAEDTVRIADLQVGPNIITGSGIYLHANNGSYTSPTGFATPRHVLVVSRQSSDAAIAVSGGTTGSGAVVFGDSGDIDAGAITYKNSTDELVLRASGSDRITIGSSETSVVGDVAMGISVTTSTLNTQLQSSTSTRDAGNITWAWISATDATRASRADFSTYYTSTERTSLSIGGDSSGSLLSFHDAALAGKPDITGSRAGNAALADLLTKLATIGLITDSTT